MRLTHKAGLVLASLAALGLAAVRANAQITIPINNSSFEGPVLTTGFSYDDITGWSGDTSSAINFGVIAQSSYPSFFPAGPPDGIQYAYVNVGSIFQDVGTVVTLGDTYTLTAYLGVRTDYLGSLGSINLETPDSNVLATTGAVGSVAGTFTPYTVTFTPTAGDPSLGKELFVSLFWG